MTQASKNVSVKSTLATITSFAPEGEKKRICYQRVQPDFAAYAFDPGDNSSVTNKIELQYIADLRVVRQPRESGNGG